MNRSDIKLIIVIIVFIGICLLFSNLLSSTDNNYAYIYYDNKLIQTIDLTVDKKRTYTVNGYNGKVVFETKKNSIRVKSETSPLHLCSNMGYIDSSFETIVCLPNKIVVKIVNNNNEIDTIVR